MRIALIDNRDSFVFNLRQMLRTAGAEVTILPNTDLQAPERFDRLVLSPGPGLPGEAGVLEDIIRTYADHKPMLGICLGEQAIATAFGGSLHNLQHVFHGIRSDIQRIADDPLLTPLPKIFPAGRYHSWTVCSESLPDCLRVTAISHDEQIMALRHKTLPVYGLQFHPESVLTPNGQQIIDAFINL